MAEGGACWEQLVQRAARRAKMIQAILVFNNHGKPRLVRFYQRFVSAARLRSAPSGRPCPLPSPMALVASASEAQLTEDLGLLHSQGPHIT